MILWDIMEIIVSVRIPTALVFIYFIFLVRRDESPENYCHSPASSLLLSSSVDKNFNLAHNL